MYATRVVPASLNNLRTNETYFIANDADSVEAFRTLLQPKYSPG